jgi:DNA topoisomerase-1
MAKLFPIYRQRHGKGSIYFYSDGKRVKSPLLLDQINALVIPPKWKDVTIDLRPRSNVRATGIDSKGRKQYIYSTRHIEQRDLLKYSKLLDFGEMLPRLRRKVFQHLKHRQYDREKVLACMVRLIDLGNFRPGNEEYARENATYGLTTIRRRHVEVKGDTMIFDFIGKKSVPQHREITDPQLAPIVRKLDNTPGYEVFKFFDDQGGKHDVSSDDLNHYIKEIIGSEFSAKDFRTWAATKHMATLLAKAPPPTSKTAAKRAVTGAVKEVSKALGNTPAVARRSYIDPKVITAYQEGRTIATLAEAPVRKYLQKNERAVLQLLKEENNQK